MPRHLLIPSLFLVLFAGCHSQTTENVPSSEGEPSEEAAASLVAAPTQETSGEEVRAGAPVDSSAQLTQPGTWDLSTTAAGTLPPTFVGATGDWAVTEDASQAGAHIFVQRAEGRGFNVMLATDTSYQDVDITVRMRAIAGVIDQGGGPLWRAQDADNYYVARYNPLEDNFRFYTVVDGHRTELASATVSLDRTAWHTLHVTMQGDHVRCAIDGTEYIDIHDTTFTSAGQVGLWTKADAQTYFEAPTVALPTGTPQ